MGRWTFYGKYSLVSLSIGLALNGCATNEPYLSKVSLGMNKQQVIGVKGTPSSVSAKGQTEYLIYNHCSGYRGVLTGNCTGVEEEYYVRLVNNRVESYGHVGDFDSTQNPTLNLNINK